MIKLTRISIIVLFPIACKGQDKEMDFNRQTAMILNDRAMEMIFDNRGNTDSIEAAIKLFDDAINLDKSYSKVYINKSNTLCQLNRVEDAISTLKNLLVITDTVPEIRAQAGFFYERLGNISTANEFYNSALNEYDKLLEHKPYDATLKVNRAFLLFFIFDNNKALAEFKSIKNQFPKNPEVIYIEQAFLTFDRKAFIEGLCGYH